MATLIGKIKWNDNYLLVAAMDIGTTYSGYAFSFKSKPGDIVMNKTWDPGCPSYKTPTCVLTTSGVNGAFVAFGSEAERMYRDSAADGSVRYDMYHRFKMLLYTEKNLTSRTKVKSLKGTTRPLQEIFTMLIKALKDHMVEAIKASGIASLGSKDIRWVLTIPAIWSQKAKQFVREAAIKAGLDRSHMILSVEPEAASLHCRHTGINNFVPMPDFTKDDIAFKAGTKYMLIDAGGGTVDFTAHEILPDDKVGEMHTASGGDWGGTKVDDNFVNFLREIMGEKFVQRYGKEYPQQWYEFLLKFENAKRTVTSDKGFNIEISYSLANQFDEWEDQSLSRKVKESASKGVSESNGYLAFTAEVTQKIFSPVVNKIISHINMLEKSKELKDVRFDYLFLVGGFGASPFLQQAMQDHYKDKPVLIPVEAQTAVIKGAIHYGHNPSIIEKRKSQLTYGVGTLTKFNNSVHRPEKKCTYDGIDLCKDLFLPFIQKGEDIELNTSGKTVVSPASASASRADISFHSLNRKVNKDEILYLDSPGVELIATIAVLLPDGHDAELEILFGDTEIRATTTDTNTGVESTISLNFMHE